MATAKTLSLPEPLNASGSKDTSLHQSVEKTYDRLTVLKKDGKTHAIIHSTNKDEIQFPGLSVQNFLYALINGSFAGKGTSPDGSCLYVEESEPEVIKVFGAKFRDYQLLVEPVEGGRSGMKKYQASIGDLLTICKAKAGIIRTAEDKFGVARSKTRAGTAKEEKEAEVTF
jgi:hypothetical protein